MKASLVVFLPDGKGSYERREHVVSTASKLYMWWEFYRDDPEPGMFCYTVNRSSPHGPPEPFDVSSKTWCPYCAGFRLFDYDGFLEREVCRVCHVSLNDYWVRKFNDLIPCMDKDLEIERRMRHGNHRRNGQQREDDAGEEVVREAEPGIGAIDG